MKAIYGVTNISPLILDAYLSKYERKKRIRLKKRIIDPNMVAVKHDVDVVFAMSFKSVTANLKSLNLSNAVVFVFDSPILLKGVGVDIVDAIVNSDMTKHKFINFTEASFYSLLGDALKSSSNHFNPVKSSVSSSYLLQHKDDSITQMLLNITLPASDENKRRITNTLVKWLMGKSHDMTGLIESIEDLVEVDALILLGKFLESNAGKNTIAVFDSIEDGMGDRKIKSLCREKGVPSFDVLYLLSQIKSNTRGK